jgi:hypothetical protein
MHGSWQLDSIPAECGARDKRRPDRFVAKAHRNDGASDIHFEAELDLRGRQAAARAPVSRGAWYAIDDRMLDREF